MDSEVAYLISISTEDYAKEIGGVVYHVVQLEGKDVVLCKAGVGKSLSDAKTVCIDADVFKGLIATAKVVSHETYGQWLVVVFDNSGKIVLNMVASM